MDGDLMAEAQPAFCLQKTDSKHANTQKHTKHTKKQKLSTQNTIRRDELWAGESAQVYPERGAVDEQLSRGELRVFPKA